MQLSSKIFTVFCIACLICGLLTVDCGLIYGQDNYLSVKGKTKADTLRFEGNLSDYPLTPLEGELFYHRGLGYLKYFNGRNWMGFGSGPKVVASVLVAAADSTNRSAADYLCDGSDDQLEIQAAIDALGAKAGAVYLLEGTYNISGPINLDNTIPDDSGKSIIGAGKATVLKVKAGTTGVNVINVSVAEGILISQLMIDGNNTNNSRGINFDRVTRSQVDKVWIENATEGILLASSSYNSVSGSHFQNAVIKTGQVTGFGNSEGNRISYNQLENISGDALVINSANNNVISNNNVQNNTAAGIRLESGEHNIISQNNVQGNAGEGILLTGTDISFNNINGNNVQGNGTYGILLYSISGPGPKDNIITANTIYDNGGLSDCAGIKLGQGADQNIISFNSIIDSAGTGYGINISTNTCDDNYLVSNLIDGAGYAGRAISDSGTNTKYTDRRKITLERTQLDISDFSYTLDSATPAWGYVALNPSVNTSLSLADGRSLGGDLLILENISATHTVTVNKATNVKLGDDDDDGDNDNNKRTLQQYDILKLIWNGTKWLETDYVNNQS